MNGQKRMRWLLIGSLTVNLFLVGLIAGQWIYDWRDGATEGRPQVRLHLGGALRSLPPDTRQVAREVMERHRPATRAAFGEMRRSRAGIAEALSAEPFKPEALEAALSAYREAAGAAHSELHRAMIEVAAKLPPGARKSMAEHMMRRRDEHRRPPRAE